MGRSSQSNAFVKVRRALIFSILSTMMETFNGVFRPVDIIGVALTLNFVCSVFHTIILKGSATRRRLHCGYILRSISRQSVLVVSDVVANSIHMRDVGTQLESTLLLVISTTISIAMITLIPGWFMQDSVQGSLRDILIFSFTSRYRQLHVPGLKGLTGIGTMIYGILFVLTNILDNPAHDATRTTSVFMTTLCRAASMVFSNQFLSEIIPQSSSQVFPVSILIATYIVSDHMPMSSTVSAFVLWRTAQEISMWTSRVFPGGSTEEILLFCLLLCILPVLNHKTASVLAVASLQTLVRRIMHAFVYFGTTSAVIVSMCMLLATDIVLDAPK